MDNANAHDLQSSTALETSLESNPELPLAEADGRPSRTARIHSVYDLGANDKITRATREKIRTDAAAEVALAQREDIAFRRPQTRADCLAGGFNAARPCPFVSCAHHLYLEVHKDTGALQVNLPGREVEDLEHSCALDVVDARPDGVTLEEVGALFNRTRERVRQLEAGALAKARRHLAVLDGE